MKIIASEYTAEESKVMSYMKPQLTEAIRRLILSNAVEGKSSDANSIEMEISGSVVSVAVPMMFMVTPSSEEILEAYEMATSVDIPI